MGAQYSVTATFVDHKGHKATVRLNNPQGLTNFMTMDDAKDFGRGIAKYSRAGLESVTSSATEYIGERPDGFGVATTISGEHYDKVEQKMVLFYRVKDSGKMHKIEVPAPNDNCFDDQVPKGDVIEDIADIIGSASNLTSGSLVCTRAGFKSRLGRVTALPQRTGV